MISNKMYLGKQHFLFQSLSPQAFQFFLGRTAEQKDKKEEGPADAKALAGRLEKGIFTLLRLKLERFLFSLIKRNTKQKNFRFLN